MTVVTDHAHFDSAYWLYMRQYVAGLDTSVPTRDGERPYINFDNAASTPPFVGVLQSVHDFAGWYSSVHRGNGLKSRLSTEAYEQARQIVGRFVGADRAEHVVIFCKNTTEAINKLSYRLDLHKRDIVLISNLEHHSNDLPWRARATVKRIATTADGAIDQADFMRLLGLYAGRVRLVAISGSSNVTGYMPDVHWFARKAHAAGAQIAVDCAQLAAHRSIRMGGLDEPDHLDYVAFSGHKMYAPFGSGALVGRFDTFMDGEPEYRGGGTVSVVTPTTVDWAAVPDKDEAGSPNVVGAVALARAVQTLTHIGFGAIARHETELTRYTLKRLQEVPGISIYGDADPARAASRAGVIPFALSGVPAHLVAAILGFEWGIGVRSGCFCAQPYVMSLLGLDHAEVLRIRHSILRGQRGNVPGMVRVSFGLYNTRDEVDRLVMALKAIARGDYQTYSQEAATGLYSPVNSSEDLPGYCKALGL